MNLHRLLILTICILIPVLPIKSHSDEPTEETTSMDLQWMEEPQYALQLLLELWRDLRLGIKF